MTDTRDYILTTFDNPYNPFVQWDLWLAFDERNGYDTNGLLARHAKTSNSLSDEDNEELIDTAVDEIMKLYPGVYKVVYKD